MPSVVALPPQAIDNRPRRIDYSRMCGETCLPPLAKRPPVTAASRPTPDGTAMRRTREISRPHRDSLGLRSPSLSQDRPDGPRNDESDRHVPPRFQTVLAPDARRAYSPRIATARVQPAEAPLIFTGKHATVKPVAGSASRLASFSIWQ